MLTKFPRPELSQLCLCQSLTIYAVTSCMMRAPRRRRPIQVLNYYYFGPVARTRRYILRRNFAPGTGKRQVHRGRCGPARIESPARRPSLVRLSRSLPLSHSRCCSFSALACLQLESLLVVRFPSSRHVARSHHGLAVGWLVSWSNLWVDSNCVVSKDPDLESSLTVPFIPEEY